MSKNLTIDEGGESRHFDGVRRLKTKLMGENAGTCYWVPDDETQAWPTFIMDNGMHVAEDEGVYGFSDAMVNVYIPTPFPDWDIWIDDIDIPHIHIDDIDIHIDDIDIHIDDIDISIDDDDGTPIVDIEGIDLDGIEIPNIDIHMDDDGLPTSDIDFKTDIHVWTDPDDPTKIHIKEEPNGEEIVLDYDDIDGTVTFKDLIDIRYDDTEDKWIIEASTKIKVDDVDYEAGDEIRSWDKDEIVDFTMKVEQVISVDFPDIDPDFGEDFDIKLDLDNMELDMDGLDMDIDLPLLKMPDFDDELPDEIRIMHVPDKTSYQDGEAIDLDGIVVQAYVNGRAWKGTDGKYLGGYVPAHELSASRSIGGKVESEYGEVEYDTSFHAELFDLDEITFDGQQAIYIRANQDMTTSDKACIDPLNEDTILIASSSPGGPAYDLSAIVKYYFLSMDSPYYDSLQEAMNNGWEVVYANGPFDEDIVVLPALPLEPGDEVDHSYTKNEKTAYYKLVHRPFDQNREFRSFVRDVTPKPESSIASQGLTAWVLVYGNDDGSGGRKRVIVSWPRPIDGQTLIASFPITIVPA